MRHERDYIDRTIETVRVHRDAENCWPQWANVFADDIEDLRAELARLQDGLREIATDGYGLGIKAQEYARALLADTPEDTFDPRHEAPLRPRTPGHPSYDETGQ